MMRTTMTRSLQVSLETVCVCWLVMMGYGRVIDLCFCNEAVRAHCVCVCVCVCGSFPVAQLVEHGVSNAKIMGSIPRESKS